MEGNLITCSTCDDLHVKICEISQRCGIWKGRHHIWSVVLTGENTMIITKNGTDEITPEYDILYIVRTRFSWRFRVWSQNSNILSVASDMACFLCINGVNDQFNHSKCSNCYNCYHCSQDIVLYVQNVGPNSLHQPSRYWLW